eukprot:4473006-Lingulodinium_polyedra.AAC.1
MTTNYRDNSSSGRPSSLSLSAALGGQRKPHALPETRTRWRLTPMEWGKSRGTGKTQPPQRQGQKWCRSAALLRATRMSVGMS